MKEDYRIFVEGIADECFLRQLIGYHWRQVKEDSIIITGGYQTYCLQKQEIRTLIR